MTWELTPEIETKICNGLANGRSLISICKDKGMPSYDTVGRWLNKSEEFAATIARAREIQADYFLDKQIEFADIATIDDYQLRKFQADNLKWVASKMKPKKYGDKTTISGDAENPHVFEVKAPWLTKEVAQARGWNAKPEDAGDK